MNCLHCASALSEPGEGPRALCATCSDEFPAASVDPRVMADLTRYWERRLMEGREKDWT